MEPVRVLFVCAGNSCRSPMAAGMAQALGAELGRPIAAASVGVACRDPGAPADPRAVAAARKRGVDLSAHRRRQASSADFAAADLIVAMDQSTCARMRQLAPAGAEVRVERLRTYASSPGDGDIPDPWHGGPADYDAALDLIVEGVRGLLQALASQSQANCSLKSS